MNSEGTQAVSNIYYTNQDFPFDFLEFQIEDIWDVVWEVSKDDGLSCVMYMVHLWFMYRHFGSA